MTAFLGSTFPDCPCFVAIVNCLGSILVSATSDLMQRACDCQVILKGQPYCLLGKAESVLSPDFTVSQETA